MFCLTFINEEKVSIPKILLDYIIGHFLPFCTSLGPLLVPRGPLSFSWIDFPPSDLSASNAFDITPLRVADSTFCFSDCAACAVFVEIIEIAFGAFEFEKKKRIIACLLQYMQIPRPSTPALDLNKG